jgi:uncharacterized protein (DUF1501 family)
MSWDTHHSNFLVLRAVLPAYDAAVCALVTDLAQRGLDRDVAVVVWGDMGRTPRIDARPNFAGVPAGAGPGRHHWSDAGFALVAGGGLRMGQVIGATDAQAAWPRGAAYTPRHVLATLYRHVLGIDPDTTLLDRDGRPHPVLGGCEPVKELL